MVGPLYLAKSFDGLSHDMARASTFAKAADDAERRADAAMLAAAHR